VHLVVTMPAVLARLALVNKRVDYDLLVRAAGAMLLQVAAKPQACACALPGHTAGAGFPGSAVFAFPWIAGLGRWLCGPGPV
jgi:hypothetical protein